MFFCVKRFQRPFFIHHFSVLATFIVVYFVTRILLVYLAVCLHCGGCNLMTGQLCLRVKWVPRYHGMARPHVADGGDGLQIRRVAANILKSSCGQLTRGILQLRGWVWG
jgi:hypothetical protein